MQRCKVGKLAFRKKDEAPFFLHTRGEKVNWLEQGTLNFIFVVVCDWFSVLFKKPFNRIRGTSASNTVETNITFHFSRLIISQLTQQENHTGTLSSDNISYTLRKFQGKLIIQVQRDSDFTSKNLCQHWYLKPHPGDSYLLARASAFIIIQVHLSSYFASEKYWLAFVFRTHPFWVMSNYLGITFLAWIWIKTIDHFSQNL